MKWLALPAEQMSVIRAAYYDTHRDVKPDMGPILRSDGMASPCGDRFTDHVTWTQGVCLHCGVFLHQFAKKYRVHYYGETLL